MGQQHSCAARRGTNQYRVWLHEHLLGRRDRSPTRKAPASRCIERRAQLSRKLYQSKPSTSRPCRPCRGSDADGRDGRRGLPPIADDGHWPAGDGSHWPGADTEGSNAARDSDAGTQRTAHCRGHRRSCRGRARPSAAAAGRELDIGGLVSESRSVHSPIRRGYTEGPGGRLGPRLYSLLASA